MKQFLFLTGLILLTACAANAPDGEMERMRAQMPQEQNPPASYNAKGIGVP